MGDLAFMRRVVPAWFVLTPAGAAGPWFQEDAAYEAASPFGWEIQRREVELYDDGTCRPLLEGSFR